MGGSGIDNAPPFARLHAGNRRADGVEGGGAVNGDNRIPFFGREILNWRNELNTGIVDENIAGPELGFAVFHHLHDFVGLHHVGSRIETFDAEISFNLGTLGLDRRRIAQAVNHDVGTLSRQGAGNGEADTGRRAGDNGVAGFKGHILAPDCKGWR